MPPPPSPHPTPVALYACVSDGADPVRVLAPLRRLAREKGWVVVDALYDTGPHARPPRERVAWCRLDSLAEGRAVGGVVAPDRYHLSGYGDAESGALARWARNGTFLAYVAAGTP